MKKLCRVSNDSKIAGVCSGLGDYYSFDPVFFRILFIVLTVLGGLGIVCYLVMWLVVPKSQDHTINMNTPHRLYLSVENKKVAGVCAGLGDYFHVDPVFFRCGFVVLLFVGGLGLFLYVVSWLILPKGP